MRGAAPGGAGRSSGGCAVVQRKFAVGDRVRLTAEKHSVKSPQDVYTISRMLPAEAKIWQYRVKREGDGQEWVVSETQLVQVTPES